MSDEQSLPKRHPDQKDIKTIARSQIVNLPYNPRTIDRSARKRLKDGVKHFGLVDTLVWNARTGNLVGGNQRLGVLDERAKNHDYSLDVSVVDLDDTDEKKLALLLNNESAMGMWDAPQLSDIVAALPNLDFTGFDKVSLSMMLPEFNVNEIFAEASGDAQDVEKIAAIKAKKKQARQEAKTENDVEFYIVIVFESREDCTGFLRELQLDEGEKYFSGARFRELYVKDATLA